MQFATLLQFAIQFATLLQFAIQFATLLQFTFTVCYAVCYIITVCYTVCYIITVYFYSLLCSFHSFLEMNDLACFYLCLKTTVEDNVTCDDIDWNPCTLCVWHNGIGLRITADICLCSIDIHLLRIFWLKYLASWSTKP